MPHLLSLACALMVWADPPKPAAPTPPASPSPIEIVSALETVLADAIARAEPSVVAIAREKSSGSGEETTAIRGRNPAPPAADPRFFMQQDLVPDDAISFDYGSGVVVGDRGQILTAYHVVKGAGRLNVRALGHPSFDAEIIAADPRSDLAVIVPRPVPGLAPPRLTPLPIGDSSKLRKGSFVIALGNPYNAMRVGRPGGSVRDGLPSASWGILSNVARRLEIPAEGQRQTPRPLSSYPTLLQLDAKLNLGMSGGAVINLKGELVGLTTAGANAAGFDAMAGYAIPMDALGRRLVETLKEGKECEYGFLGIHLDPAGSNRVEQAQPGTPAGEGGVQTHDLILAVGDVPTSSAEELVLAINGIPPGVPIRLKLQRGDKVIEKTVELSKYPPEPGVIATNLPPAWRGLRVDYPSILPNGMVGQETLDALAKGGVSVVEVESGSPADKAGLGRGRVITHVKGKKVRSPREFAEAVGDAAGPVPLLTDEGPVVIP